MGRIITVAVIVISALLVWKSGALNSVLGGGSPVSTGQEPTVALSQTYQTMAKLRSVHVSVSGTSLFADQGEVSLTGNGDVSAPHKEALSLQFQVPGKGVLPLNERMENGHLYLQNPTQGTAWKDVTGKPSAQLLPELDPLNNLDFLQAARASDDMGTMAMDSITVDHFSINVDPARYVDQLKADPSSGVSDVDSTALSNAAIHVQVWVSPVDHYIHQMQIEMTATQFSWDVTYRFSNFQTANASTSA